MDGGVTRCLLQIDGYFFMHPLHLFFFSSHHDNRLASFQSMSELLNDTFLKIYIYLHKSYFKNRINLIFKSLLANT